MKYTKEHFIAKFEAIPDAQWCTGMLADDDGRRCALGHCCKANRATREASALCVLFPMMDTISRDPIAQINDGQDSRYQQPTPKARVLAALRDLP